MGIQNFCSICNLSINDLYYLIVGGKFTIHLNCMKCSLCNAKMENKCFIKNGKFICDKHRPDQVPTSLINCSNCNSRINSNDFVINSNSNVYHLNCFKCFKCNCLLEPGSKYALVNNNLYCYKHYLSDESRVPDLNNNNRFDQTYSLSSSNSLNTISSADSSPLSAHSSATNLINKNKFISNNNNNNHHHQHHQQQQQQQQPLQSKNNNFNSKKKRIRTSFKHQQLRIMKAHFQINQNPDSKDLKELSERTGLQKRVLQVWFQNSRAKQRKSNGPNSIGFGSILNLKNNDSMLNNNLMSSQEENSNGINNQNNNNDTLEDYDDDLDEEVEELEEDEDEENLDLNDSRSNEMNNFQNQSIIDFYQYF